MGPERCTAILTRIQPPETTSGCLAPTDTTNSGTGHGSMRTAAKALDFA